MIKISVLVCLLLCSCCFVNSSGQDPGSLLSLKSSIEQYLNNGTQPLNLTAALQGIEFPHLFRRDTDVSLFNKDFTCLTCDVLVNLLLVQFWAGIDKQTLANEVIFICTATKIEDQAVCSGLVQENLDIFEYIAKNDKKFNGHRVCGLLLQKFDCYPDKSDWKISIPPRGHTKKKAVSTDTFNILHITDIHLDPRYTEGKKVDCGEPLCCQDDQKTADVGDRPCGYWSEYLHVDTPVHLLEEVIAQSGVHDFDYVYMTGDLVSHRVWETSIEGNTETITRTYDLLLQNYHVPIFPVLGNHEAHPVNQYSEIGEESSFSMQWLFSLFAKKWSKRVSGEDTIMKGGFYTVSPRKGFRIVSLNNNVCYSSNWWLLLNDNDPYDQLKWLVEVLLKAEENDEVVHLLGHVPPGADCHKPWSREFNRIIERFSHIVAAQFYGHTHMDEFYIHYNSSNELEAIGVGFNGASVNTDLSNPSYKIYTVDSIAYNVVDMFQYTFNLTLANEDPVADPQWYTQYSFKSAYGLSSMQPMDMDALVIRMARNHSLLDQQFRYTYRDSDWAYQRGCDHTCRKKLLCTMVTTDASRTTKCKSILGIYDDNV
ncbi:unnamed protein product [Acanthoscelides obtectus]|uniref:Sphingomyelin phosphodiesterase n=1 Tax=Acanthoscelides obtectus TaxID=200917 RepID=A0A9P0K8A5_ACAOB|nr:unnamed protein product [Acanthoscelides obtectus]CAK1652029.1 Sphingomyelin phosphodiesterase [Acanthoscelides obtectus]